MKASFFCRSARVLVQVTIVGTLSGWLAGCTNLQREAGSGAPSDQVAGRTSGGAAQPSALDSQLAGLNRQIEGRQEYNAKVRALAEAKEQELAAILASDRSPGPGVEEFELRTSAHGEIGKIDRAARAWQETIDAHQAVLKGAVSDPRQPELAAEINRLVEERAELLRLRTRLSTIQEKLTAK